MIPRPEAINGDDVLPDENRHNPEQIKQSILEGAQVGGDVNIRDITQIIVNPPEQSSRTSVTEPVLAELKL